MSSAAKYSLELGPSAPAIRVQLRQQGLSASADDCTLWQRVREATTLLSVHGYLSHGQRNTLLTKLSADVAKGTREAKEGGR